MKFQLLLFFGILSKMLICFIFTCINKLKCVFFLCVCVYNADLQRNLHERGRGSMMEKKHQTEKGDMSPLMSTL